MMMMNVRSAGHLVEKRERLCNGLANVLVDVKPGQLGHWDVVCACHDANALLSATPAREGLGHGVLGGRIKEGDLITCLHILEGKDLHL